MMSQHLIDSRGADSISHQDDGISSKGGVHQQRNPFQKRFIV